MDRMAVSDLISRLPFEKDTVTGKQVMKVKRRERFL